ncbi:MAG: ribonuclease G [Pseudomonadales bacterium]|nr:ribonuclease G [Pseudomonadales bacterium]
MSEEFLINVSNVETRVALLENGVLQEIRIERDDSKILVGNIYKGKVVRVLPGMQAAFVDIGLERAAFIHAKEILPIKTGGDAGDDSHQLSISELVRDGQSLVVQVTKDMIGSKGARLTTHLSIPSRYLVYMPYSDHVGISQRIDEEEERERLRAIVSEFMGDNPDVTGGFILRTAADGVSAEDILKDIEFLLKVWGFAEVQIGSVPVTSVVYEGLPLLMRTVRDLTEGHINQVRIDSEDAYQMVINFVRQFVPSMESHIENYVGDRPIFDLYGVEDELEKALHRNVGLKSGGHLVIDQTEAMTTVDVNTGTYVGHRNLEETIYKTNLEAAHAISRQLRLRNLGGIIIVDFIDMEEEEHRRQVLRTFEKMLERDYAKTNITGVSDLGLVEMTRKRTSESLEHVLCEPCPVCVGRGSLKTATTICYEIFREIRRVAHFYEAKTFMVIASQAVIDRLLDEESAHVADLAEYYGCNITFQVESMYQQETFDVVLL